MKILDHYIYKDIDSQRYVGRVIVGKGTILDSQGFKYKKQAEAWLKMICIEYRKAKRLLK